jgi:hypothetical protein
LNTVLNLSDKKFGNLILFIIFAIQLKNPKTFIMTLNQFLTNFDFENSIVLLEGKRNVSEHDIPKLIMLGKKLAESSRYIKFRSGNASGADFYFSQGVAQVNSERMQVIIPYGGHRSKNNLAFQTISLDDINISSEPDIIYQSKTNKKTKELIDKYVSGNRDRYSINAAYIIRDTIKVLGTHEIPPSSFCIFYDDLNNPEQGGTGHTMNVCKMNNIPFIDQSTWFGWL